MRRNMTEISEEAVWQAYLEAPESAHGEDRFWEFVERMIEEDVLAYDYDTNTFYRE